MDCVVHKRRYCFNGHPLLELAALNFGTLYSHLLRKVTREISDATSIIVIRLTHSATIRTNHGLKFLCQPFIP